MSHHTKHSHHHTKRVKNLKKLIQGVQRRFSDVCVTCFYKTYPLHRIILMQSPYFERLFQKDTHNDITLETDNDPRINQEGIEIALKDLYDLHGRKVRETLVTSDNAVFVLASACFLELVDLADFCLDFLLTAMNPETITCIMQQLERLSFQDQKSQPPHQYAPLLKKYYQVLEKSCLSYLYQLVCALCFESNSNYVPQKHFTHYTCAEEFLSKIPLKWIKKIMDVDSLTLESEFARYKALKRIFNLRDVSKSNKEELDVVKESIPESNEPPSYWNLFENVMPSRKKRKRDTDEVFGTVDLQYPQIFMNREQEKDFQREMLRTHVAYSHMTFKEPKECQQDGLIPDSILLQAFWEQAELLHGFETKRNVPFRFTVHFTNYGDLFSGSDSEKTLYSDPFNCCGVQYRVLLCREKIPAVNENSSKEDETLSNASHVGESFIVKALLQRTRTQPKTDPADISYSIYMFDRFAFLKGKIQDASFLDPLTLCEADGSGHAKPAPISEADAKRKKCDLWLTVVIRFSVASNTSVTEKSQQTRY